jgi:hypothetical protein
MSELPETVPDKQTSDDPRLPPQGGPQAEAEPASPAKTPVDPASPVRSGPAPPRQRRAARRSGRAAAWLALLLILVLAGVAAVPFWAPFVTPLLPWSRYQADRERTIAAQLAALDKENAAARAEIAGLRSAQDALTRRLDASTAALAGFKAQLAGFGRKLDAAAAPPAALADFKAKIADLDRRLAAMAAQPAAPADLEARIADLDRRLAAVAAQPAVPADLQARLADFDRRLDAVAARAAARPAVDPAALQKLQQDVASLDQRAGDLAGKVAALRAGLSEKTRSADNETALLLALLQMHEGIETAQPFTIPYDAFIALAQGRPQLAAAATPLAPLAVSGVASRAALARDLSRLADRIATARPAAGPREGEDWSARVLDQLRGLVTIRRLDGGGRTPAAAAVEQAEADLARGDLAAAVKIVQTLSGPPAALAQPWLAAARWRLTAEAALSRLQQMLAARALPQAAPAIPPTAAPGGGKPKSGAHPADPGLDPAPTGQQRGL